MSVLSYKNLFFYMNMQAFKLTWDANERNSYLSNAYRTNASFSPGFIVHLKLEQAPSVVHAIKHDKVLKLEQLTSIVHAIKHMTKYWKSQSTNLLKHVTISWKSSSFRKENISIYLIILCLNTLHKV